MRTGERLSPGGWRRAGARGFTYLWLLFLIAMTAATLASIGERTSTVAQREREQELMFRGQEIARAIASYHAAPGIRPGQWPASLDDLIEDRRGPDPRHHLRRAYTDPYTGEPDWVPVLGPDERWRGVHSRSGAPSTIHPSGAVPSGAPRTPRVSDHLFMAAEPAAAASGASSP